MFELSNFINSLPEEPVSEDMDVIAREYAGIPCDAPKDLTYCVHDKKAKYDAVLFGAQWQKEQIKKAMDLGEPPYLISVEQAYYRTLKLLED